MFEFFDFENIESYLPTDSYQNILVIYDDNLYHHYSNKIDTLPYHKYQIESGESSKNLKTKLEIEDFMFSNNFNKKSCLIALGGGVVGDLTGFIASTFMRGIDFYQVPTTLLAMVDSSIGGKTGIDNKWGKNLIGSFYLPKKILCDINFLNTLKEEEFINGLAEVIKTAIVANPKLWKFLNNNNFKSIYQNSSNIEKIIDMTAKTKLGIVNQDFDEKLNQRHILNFGHTIGHAIEALTLEKHGYCVAIGMVKEILLKQDNKYMVPFYLQKQIINCLIKYKLPVDINLQLNHQDILDKLKLDKKNGLLVLVKDIGNPFLTEFSKEQILDTLSLEKLVTYQEKSVIKSNIFCPSSKSETNRVLILAALGDGEIQINNLLMSDDTIYMIQALQTLGTSIKILDSSTVKVKGNSGKFNFTNNTTIYLGNSGTCVRFLTAVLGLLNTTKTVIITGDSYMQKRPIQDLIDSLNNLGVAITSINNDGCPPLILKGKNTYINSNKISISTLTSSQYLTGLLLASPLVPNNNIIETQNNIVSQSFVDLTINIIRDFGIEINYEKNMFFINYQKYKNPIEYTIQADTSSASYILGLSALMKNPIVINNLNNQNKQGDLIINKLALNKLGFDLVIDQKESVINFFSEKQLENERIIDCDSSDTFLTWAIVACFIQGTTKIVNIANQNVKECKRIDVIYQHLVQAKVNIKMIGTDLEITGNSANNYQGIYVNCHNDHRIAMSFALFGLMVPDVILSDYTCVNKTFPSFWELVSDFGLTNNYVKKDKDIQSDYQPIILIGMTKSGKSTLGKSFAKKYNKTFVDTDQMIVKNFGLSPEEIIKASGWDYFRKIESIIFHEILENEEFQVISTGGGIIERHDNLYKLNKYKYVIHVIRDLNQVQKYVDKVLWKNKLKETWEVRKDIYLQYSKYQFFNDSDENKFNNWLSNIINPPKINPISYFLCLDGSNLSNKRDFFENLNVDAIELRFDLYQNYSIELLDQQINLLHKFTNIPIIFTLRSSQEGGKYNLDDYQTIKLLERAIYNGISLVDIELRLQKSIDRKHCLMIGSCHSEFWNKMETTVKKGFYFHKPDIIKMVGNIKFHESMLELSEQFNVNKIVISSGSPGKITRVNNKFLTPVTDTHFSKAAVGQLTKEEIESIRKIIWQKKDFYLIGQNISKSPSPFIHNHVFNYYQLYNNYQLLEIDSLDTIKDTINSDNFGGASVTIPYKEEIINLIDDLTNDAKNIGAVNTIIKKENKLIGDNTDWKALYNILKSYNTVSLGCVIGTGGAARAAYYAFQKAGIPFDILGRDDQKGEKLVKEFNAKNFLQINQLNDQHQIIIVCVPNYVIIPFENLNQRTIPIIIDMSYSKENSRNYPKTVVLYNGYQILSGQAIEQFKCWESNRNNLDKVYNLGMKLFLES